MRNSVTIEQAKKIISTNQSPDINFDQSVNPYRGCEHGCIYCYARPTHAYLGLSPGLDFESKLVAKSNAPELLLHELAAKNYRPKTIALGANTDPYQPAEKSTRVTRQLLELFQKHEHPVNLITKGNLISREEMEQAEAVVHRPLNVFVDEHNRIVETRSENAGQAGLRAI